MPTVVLDGRTVAYLEAGQGQRTADRRATARAAAPLLLVHGYTGSKEDFASVLAQLGEERRAVAVDLPGHGDSQALPDPGGYGLWATAQWLLRLADVLGLGEYHLLGHSMGGLVVQRVAAAASQRLRSLVLMDTGLAGLRQEAAEVVARIGVAARDEGIEAAWRESRRASERRAPRYHTSADRDEFVRRRFLALDPAAVVVGARNLITAAPLTAFLRDIDLPVLVVHGEHDDAWTPHEQRVLARTVRGAELAVVPDSRHSPQLENPQAWLRAVRGFLRRAEEDQQRGPRAGVG
ncbi:MAG TPA: alpha/beta fold hydrolase [Egibacteraceae bacterium]|nr:alpha/beta fold hydrolase [Egibacteraceae bacterium]